MALEPEGGTGDFPPGLIEEGLAAACHDVASGGIAVALAEMAISGGLGATISMPENGGIPAHGWLFAEDQGRYLLTAPDPDPVMASAQKAGIAVTHMGETAGDLLTVGDSIAISVAELERTHQSWLPEFMAAPDENLDET